MIKYRLSYLIILMMIGLLLPAAALSAGSVSAKDQYVVQVNSVTIAEPDRRAGGLPAYEVDDRIKDCGCPPCCGDALKKEVVKPQENEESVLCIQFETGRWIVGEQYDNDIQKIADFMKEFPGKKIVIKGYTDSRGDEHSNRALSEKRAESVRRILIDKHAIDGFRISAIGHGEEKPVASNYSEEGRKKNRRIEAFLEDIRTK